MSVYADARWHPIVWVVSMLGIPIDRLNDNAMTCCPVHEQQPKMTVILNQKSNTWECQLCGKQGDAIDFVAALLFRKKIEAADWIVRNCRILPPPN